MIMMRAWSLRLRSGQGPAVPKMLEFLLAALTTATVAALLIPLLRSRVAATDRLDNDLAVYRDQLAEVERERGEGTLSEGDAASAKIEIERRILTAAERDALGARHSSGASSRFLPPALCLLIPLFALGLYLSIGHPGLPSAPFVPVHPLPQRRERSRRARARAPHRARARR